MPRILQIIICLTLSFLYSINSYSQNLSSRWQFGFAGDHRDFIQEMISISGNHYIYGAVSSSRVSGNKTSPTYGDDDMIVFEMDDAGNKLWEKSYGGSNYDQLHSIIKISSGGYILAGGSESIISGNKSSPLRGIGDFWIIKIDDIGNIIWEKTFGDPGHLNIAQKILETPDGSFIIGGRSFIPLPTGGSQQDFRVIKIDNNGNLLWSKYYGGNQQEELYSLIATADGNYFLSGTSSSGISGNKTSASVGGFDAWLVKIAPDGTKMWDKSYGTPGDDFRGNIIKLMDNNFLLIESSLNTGRIRKIDPSGNTLWLTSCSGNDQDAFDVAAENTNGDIYVAGTSKTNNAGCKTSPLIGGGCCSDIWIAVFDANGNKIDDLDYGGNDAEMVTDIDVINNEVWISGWSDSPISGNKTTTRYGQTADGWIIRLSRKLFINNLTINAVCKNVTSFKTYFTTTTAYSPGNVFTIQLSDANGNFNSPVNIGSKSSVTSDSILITIPAGLPSGSNYNLRVIATQLADTSASFPIFFHDNPTVNLGPDISFCENTVVILNSGAQLPNSKYLWSNGSTGSNLSISLPGFYWVEVQNNCGSTRDSIQATVKPLPVTSLGMDTSFCTGSSVVVKQNFYQPMVSYLWNQGAVTDSIIVQKGGTYWLTQTNNCGSTTDTILVREKILPIINIATDTGFCKNGTVMLSPSGVLPGTSWLWSNGNSTNSITISSAGQYWLQGDLEGCKKADTIRITEYQSPNVQIQGSDLLNVCKGKAITLTATGATNYTWSNGFSGDQISVTDSGLISVTGTDIHSCKNKDSVLVRWINRENVKAFSTDTICYGSSINLYAVGGESFTWTPSSIFNNSTISNPIASPLKTTDIIVTVTSDSTGCNIGKKDTIRITVLPKVNANAGRDTMVAIGDYLQLNATGGNTYTWQPATNLNNPNIANPIALINGAITYTVTAMSWKGCTGTAKINITAIKGPEIFLPNAFSPNSDGINDIFKPVIAGFNSMNYLKIFDRFGNLIFETNQIGKGWNGMYKGNILEPNIFVWIIEAVRKDNIIVRKKGTVTLVR